MDFTWGTGAAFFWLDELKSMHAGYVSQVRNPPYPGSGGPPSPCSRQLSPNEAAFYSDPANILKGRVPNTVNAVPAGIYPGPTPGPVSPGAAITVNWSVPAGHSATDAIPLYRAGTPDGFPLRRESVASAATPGFTLPTFPGRYQFRYLPSGDARHSAVSPPDTRQSATR